MGTTGGGKVSKLSQQILSLGNVEGTFYPEEFLRRTEAREWPGGWPLRMMIETQGAGLPAPPGGTTTT